MNIIDSTFFLNRLASSITRTLLPPFLPSLLYPKSNSNPLRPFAYKLISLELTNQRTLPINSNEIKNCVDKNLHSITELLPLDAILPPHSKTGVHPIKSLASNALLVSFLRKEVLKARFLPLFHNVENSYDRNGKVSKTSMVERIKDMEGKFSEQNIPPSIDILKGCRMGGGGNKVVKKTNSDSSVAEFGDDYLSSIVEAEADSQTQSKSKSTTLPPSIVQNYASQTSSSLPQILTLAGLSTKNATAFNLYCELRNYYEFYTQEYIDSLYLYIIKLAREKDRDVKKIKIVDVGAGDGRFCSFLNNAHANCLCVDGYDGSGGSIEFEFVSEDDMSWGIYAKKTNDRVVQVTRDRVKSSLSKNKPKKATLHRQPTPSIPVSKHTLQQTLSTHCTSSGKQKNEVTIVTCGWMPHDVDFTQRIRDEKGVDAYVMVGEVEGGCVGRGWETWGDHASQDPSSLSYTSDSKPLYTRDGFTRIENDELNDKMRNKYANNFERSSKTTVFVRD